MAVAFDGVSKEYRGTRRYRALRDDIMSLGSRLKGQQRDTTVITALDDVSLEVPVGESFGLIGGNGAGKTTALKIATRITYPTAGRVRVRGRVGALIEVGTGLHPELSGRENIQLFGSILGLSRQDIRRRFDAIVEFAGVERAIDQPVKQFSSGMQLRLGFSIAAHLEPDILLVDEAIAVGDAGFQHRCVERMSELVTEGRTLVFVSHDMSAVETLCNRAVWLREGRIAADGPARDVIRTYLQSVHSDEAKRDHTVRGSAALEITRVQLIDEQGGETTKIASDHALRVRLHYSAPAPLYRPIFSVGISHGFVGCFAQATMLRDGQTPDVISGDGYIDCVFEELPLLPSAYEIWGSVRGSAGFGDLVDWQKLRAFEVTGPIESGPGAVTHSMFYSPVKLNYRWELSQDQR